MPTLHEILKGCPDPHEAPLRRFLTQLGKQESTLWRLVADDMAEHLAAAIRDEKHPVRRADLRNRAVAIDNSVTELITHLNKQEMMDAFAIHAPLGPNDADYATLFEHLLAFQRRAKSVVAAIPVRAGGDTAAPVLGRPGARLLCATMVREAFKRAKGKVPNDKHSQPLAACSALWEAADGPLSSNDDPDGTWERHLRDARKAEKQGPARILALGCLAHIQQDRA